MTKKIQIKSIFALILAFTLLPTLTYAVSSNLQSPVDSFVDDDGFLDLRASCEPGYDGTTSYNVTKADLYSNVDGTWKADKTLQVENPITNSTYYFNFTNSINQTSEGEFVWDVQCYEANSTNDGANINEVFAGTRIIKVEYAKATVIITSPQDQSHNLDGHDILIECSATPASGWNLTQIDLMANISLDWKPDQTFIIPTRSADTQFDNGFILNLSAGVDVTNIIFSCSATQIKDGLEGAPISEKSSSNRTLNIGPTCTGNICDIDNQRWCEGGLWNEGTYSHYCSRCGYADSSCPICENGICDIDNQRWCDNSTWSAINYCNSCGSVDSSCDTTCANNACDQKNRRWCNNGVWDESNYCVTCGREDSICYFECQSNACDSKNKEWCDAGSWSSLNYCDHCGNSDFSCGFTCQSNACDTTVNRWCDAGSWSSLNYCNHCQDSECLGTCTNNACDLNSKQWCNNGVWSDIDYCSRCGNKDSSCLVACQENTCDTTANKRCSGGNWVSTNYCDQCALKDSDCTISCAEGECDNLNKKVCISGEWIESSYIDLCIARDINVSVMTCKDYGNCTLDSACASNSECASGFCSGSKCAESTCSNDIKDGDETGIDCGGGECVKCSKDKGCSANSDCLSDFCDFGICGIADTCSDGILNGNEADVDCGGLCGDKCQLGRSCDIDEDCDDGLECLSRVCTKTRSAEVEIFAGEEDSDEDGIPDEWEVEHGLDPSDPSDANEDFDEDGLTNIQEYTYGTDPNAEDSDGDGISDKEEIINENTDPLDPVSKPGGIGGILIWVVTLIMVFGGGSYGIYYYKDYIMELIRPQSQIPEPGITSGYMPPKRQYAPQKHALKALPKKTKITEIVKKRREEKKEIRQKIFQAFTREGDSKQRKTGTTKEMAFSKLKSVPKKGKS